MRSSHGQSIDAMFIGYEDQENLGLRSIIATLDKEGYQTALQPYTSGDPSGILKAIQAYKPRLIGFSLIFQYTLDELAELTAALRKEGVQAHFTVGGHYPSLRPREVLEQLPHIDSVVRFEGEHTTVELLNKIHQPDDWSSIESLAFRRGTEMVVNPLRALISDLDRLPSPIRSHPRVLLRGIRVVSMLASRGCLYDCSFCSIRQFYSSSPGPLRRTRSPEAVVAEMKDLLERYDVKFFIFQDDDFAARSFQQRQWIEAFLNTLDRHDLKRQIKWKISCRVDDIDEDLMRRCHDHGLIAIYLGVESGNQAGLQTLNKRVTVAQNVTAIETLKKIDIAFDMGFMLFDPDSTTDTILENIAFLRQVTADGFCPANFCKMLPYAGTPIEVRLQKEGRLKGTTSQPDYDFLDPRLDWFALYAAKVFRFRNFDRLGLVERLRSAHFDKVLSRAFDDAPWVNKYEEALCKITARANAVALDNLEDCLNFVMTRNVDSLINDWSLLSYLAEREWQEELEIQRELDHILEIYSPELLQAYADEFSNRYVEKPQDIVPFV